MIGIDTNVLVRYIMRDDPVQVKQASRFIETLTRESPGFISAVVLAETSWVLSRTYGASPAELIKAVETLLAVDTLAVEHSAQAHNALAMCRTKGADFADAFIAEVDRQAGCAETVTFDKHAAARAGMRLLV
ncbi:MAG: type II toxin-antitoxin system VapC family toxin [Alphaproteobacteria bacterium]